MSDKEQYPDMCVKDINERLKTQSQELLKLFPADRIGFIPDVRPGWGAAAAPATRVTADELQTTQKLDDHEQLAFLKTMECRSAEGFKQLCAAFKIRFVEMRAKMLCIVAVKKGKKSYQLTCKGKSSVRKHVATIDTAATHEPGEED